MTVGLLTAVYDGYDELRHLPMDLLGDVDAVCVTDDPTLMADGWRIVHEPRPGVHPNLAAKRPKMLPWEYTDAPVSIWMDAAFTIKAPAFCIDATNYVSEAAPIAQFVHPWRQCIRMEAAASLHLPKYAGQALTAQVASYDDHPPNWGLWATGLIVREHTDAVRAFGHHWLTECEHWTFHDQLSEAPCLRAHGLRPTALPGDHMHNPWLIHEPSTRH